ncbi:hypothetical protein [Spirosoma sordidisoli]|uniref:Uncharacterized protein n=1 Tax=Spirosoma sordidisoli TaxID=2502893 RepID=A0A4Q2ULP5_9BACT|nr:hypothetical protein [Spirosoma sordidisoli]RYC69652.1 hypothetical protein EQG79_13710 [Spirosoma sordidisoli]
MPANQLELPIKGEAQVRPVNFQQPRMVNPRISCRLTGSICDRDIEASISALFDKYGYNLANVLNTLL